MWKDTHRLFMKKALLLAKRVGAETLPNPRVGAIVVKNGQIEGQGVTQPYGGLHAEAIALAQAKERAVGASLYCTLEPCTGSWEGKHQGPCTEKIIEAGIKEVYIACIDMNPRVRGKGITFLRENGVQVHILDAWTDKVLELNDRFIHLQQKKHPFIALKIAQSLDGGMAAQNNTRLMLTDANTQKKVHEIRASHQALITGVNTIKYDDPQFSVRYGNRKNPPLMILDSTLEIPLSAQVLQPMQRATLMQSSIGVVVVTTQIGAQKHKKVAMLHRMGVEVIVMPQVHHGKKKGIDIKALVFFLYTQGVYSVMVEAGPRLSASFLYSGWVSKVHVCIAPLVLGRGRGLLSENEKILPNSFYQPDNFLYYTTYTTPSAGRDVIMSGYTYDIFSFYTQAHAK